MAHGEEVMYLVEQSRAEREEQQPKSRLIVFSITVGLGLELKIL